MGARGNHRFRMSPKIQACKNVSLLSGIDGLDAGMKTAVSGINAAAGWNFVEVKEPGYGSNVVDRGE
jgi:hypothetical protein